MAQYLLSSEGAIVTEQGLGPTVGLERSRRVADMGAKIINLAEKRKERERERMIAKLNEYYRQLRAQGCIIRAPKKDE